jgi:hypothetical protein
MNAHANLSQWSYTEVQAFVGQIRSALKDRTVHGYLDVYVVPDALIRRADHCRTVVYGRRPYDKELG